MPALRERIAQLLIIGFRGSNLAKNTVADWIAKEHVGGVILFDKDLQTNGQPKNIIDMEQTSRLVCELQQHCAKTQPDLPLLVAVDYEGGAVDRLRCIDSQFQAPSAQQLAQLTHHQQQDIADKMAMQLKQLGFNLNFAPVVDLHFNHANGIIGQLGRSYSSVPEKVIEMAEVFIDAFAKQHIITCLKHFPGHGSAQGDTHEGFVDVSGTFKLEELQPFQRLISKNQQGVMVMTAHIINRQLDANGLPATLSKPILTDILRHEMGFSGVIVSDDLQMKAISDHFSLSESLKLTLNAGSDMLIIGNQLGWNTPKEVIDCVESLVESDDIPVERINEAYHRVVQLKQFLK